jgi:hypothetical protein
MPAAEVEVTGVIGWSELPWWESMSHSAKNGPRINKRSYVLDNVSLLVMA